MSLENATKNRVQTTTQCPKCGSQDLIHQTRPDGNEEILCLDADCDFSRIETLAVQRKSEDTRFEDRLSEIKTEQLVEFEAKLKETIESLGGRSKRLAKRQLAMVLAEINRRKKDSNLSNPDSDDIDNFDNSVTIPPQFKTPQAEAKRVEAIREYHRRKRMGMRLQEENEKAASTPSGSKWLDTLLKTLKDEADRHEQAAHNYARLPELFPLHIEHTARAFELNRIRDMLANYIHLIVEKKT